MVSGKGRDVALGCTGLRQGCRDRFSQRYTAWHGECATKLSNLGVEETSPSSVNR